MAEDTSKENASLVPQQPAFDTSKLNNESAALINQIIAEDDLEKTKDLTFLFNQNQNKKTLIRVSKLNELQDKMVDQALERFTNRPQEVDTATLMQGMKTVQDMIERGQKQVAGVQEQQPLIQINQQNNEVSLGGESGLNKESRDKVNKFIMAVLGKASGSQPTENTTIEVNGEQVDGSN